MKHIFPSVALAAALAVSPAQSAAWKETPMFAEDVAAGRLPPVAERLPAQPLLTPIDEPWMKVGRSGGDLRTMIPRARDLRLLATFGYTRLLCYTSDLRIEPDLLESVAVKDDRQFTMKLRAGHKWSDGHPFTAEDFRYYWENVANDPSLSPSGPPVDLLVDGEKPKVEFLDPATIRYSWSKPNPTFLARLAGTAPLFIFRPAHYLKKFHLKFAEAGALQKEVAGSGLRNWAALHNRRDNMHEFDNPEIPTLLPWQIKTRPPATRFIAERNPYFHRVDAQGTQLPYLDRIVLGQADSKLIPAKAGAGDADLQARSIAFDNYTFLKESEKRAGYHTFLWRVAKGSHVALYPNLNANDPVWRALMRDVRFRRALSLATDRGAVNDSIYFGLAIEGNNTMLPQSPLFNADYQTRWAKHDPKMANRLLDDMGLTKRNPAGVRLLPDGRPIEIIVETAGEDSEQVDVLELTSESWIKAGIKLLVKPSQRDVVRNRIFSGDALMTVSSGFENGVATADTSPAELAPTSQIGLQWPKWGQHHETSGRLGEAPDMPEAQELFRLHGAWMEAKGAERERIWHRMLELHADQQYVIGIVSGVLQPVVVNKALRNVPEKGIYNWEPGAFFGIYRPYTFWFDR